MRSDKPTMYSVHVGIDWADRKHDVCIVPPGEGREAVCRRVQTALEELRSPEGEPVIDRVLRARGSDGEEGRCGGG